MSTSESAAATARVCALAGLDEVLEAREEDLVRRSYLSVDQRQAALLQEVHFGERVRDQQGQHEHRELADVCSQRTVLGFFDSIRMSSFSSSLLEIFFRRCSVRKALFSSPEKFLGEAGLLDDLEQDVLLRAFEVERQGLEQHLDFLAEQHAIENLC